MNNEFATAMRRALELTRAGNPHEATRIIQAALAGDGVTSPAPSASVILPSERSHRVSDDIEKANVEEAEVIEAYPPRASAPSFSPAQRWPRHPEALQSRPEDLQRMLDNLGCLVPQASPFTPNGLSGKGARPDIPEGARYETRTHISIHGNRDYRLYIPRDLPEGSKGLILMLHGCTQNPDDFACGTDMNRHADRHQLIVIYPHQSRTHNPQGCWNWFRPEDQRAETGEAALLADLTRSVATEFAVPKDAIFAAGLSAGGAMAATLAATQPNLFAAVGIHSGLPHGTAHDIPSAFSAMRGQGVQARLGAKAAEVRMIIFHGTADATVHPSNADALMAAASRVVKGTTRRETGLSEGGRSWTRELVEAPDGAPLVESWRIARAGHAWAGGRPTGSFTDPAGPDASAEMVRFFLHSWG